MEPNEPIEPKSDSPIPFGLLDAGDPRFVAALRALTDAPALARFAADWSADSRPASRQLLLAYLAEVPNAPGHEGLIKRLFKLAEGAGDDEVMARFLVLADRWIARNRDPSHNQRRRSFATVEAARAQQAAWTAQGWRVFEEHPRAFRRVRLGATRPTTTFALRGTTLPRPDWREAVALAALTPDQLAQRRWFTVATRRYLQRRAWRYFRTLGRTDPTRYVAAAVGALRQYVDPELADGIALLEHFGLIHLLFGTSPTFRLKSSGWDLVPGGTLAGLAPSPVFEAAWRDRPEAILKVLSEAQAAIISRWAVRWIEADRARFAALAAPGDWVDRLDSADPAVVNLALAMLGDLPAEPLRAEIPAERWASVVESAAPASKALVADFVARLIPPGAVAWAVAARLAVHPAEPVARLGWAWIEGRGGETVPPETDPEADADVRLGLLNAASETLRPAIVRAVIAALKDRMGDRARWVLAVLNSPHADARAAGWAWFQADDALWANLEVWTSLLGSPYPDIQAACAAVADLPVEIEPTRLDRVRTAVLLRPHGASRIKPGVIRRVVARLETIPTGSDDEAGELLGLLAVVVRSARAPERRAALAALVGLAECRPEWRGRIESAVPALQFDGGPAIMPA